MREGGLGSTAWVPGQPDTWPGWEDSAVPVEAVPQYLRELRALFHKFDYNPSRLWPHGPGMHSLPRAVRSLHRAGHRKIQAVHERSGGPGRAIRRRGFRRAWRRAGARPVSAADVRRRDHAGVHRIQANLGSGQPDEHRQGDQPRRPGLRNHRQHAHRAGLQSAASRRRISPTPAIGTASPGLHCDASASAPAGAKAAARCAPRTW